LVFSKQEVSESPRETTRTELEVVGLTFFFGTPIPGYRECRAKSLRIPQLRPVATQSVSDFVTLRIISSLLGFTRSRRRGRSSHKVRSVAALAQDGLPRKLSPRLSHAYSLNHSSEAPCTESATSVAPTNATRIPARSTVPATTKKKAANANDAITVPRTDPAAATPPC
jgi:hypothetical protein